MINLRLLTEFSILVLFTNLMPGQVFGLISSFLSSRWLPVVLHGKSLEERWCSSRFHSWSCTFLTYINDLPDDVIYNIAIYADDTTQYSKCDQASDLGQQLELASEPLNLNLTYNTL